MLSIYRKDDQENTHKSIDFQEQNIHIISHIASLQIDIDNENKRFIMYFHSLYGREENGKIKRIAQNSYVATSHDDLYFNENIHPVSLGKSYFNTFEYNRFAKLEIK